MREPTVLRVGQPDFMHSPKARNRMGGDLFIRTIYLVSLLTGVHKPANMCTKP